MKISHRLLALCLALILLVGCVPAQTTETPTVRSDLQPTPAVATASSGAPAEPEAAGQAEGKSTASSEPGASARPSVDQILARFEGLDIDAFFEESYKQLLLRDPELVTELGLADALGTGNDRLTDVSDAYIRETQDLETAILAKLRTYDRGKLTPGQQVSYDAYAWYLDDLVRGHEFMYDDYPVNQLIVGVQNDLIQFFTDIHPVANQQNAKDYIARLSQVDTKFEQLLDGLKRREEAGAILPKFLVQWVLRDLQGMAQSDARSTPFYTAFERKVNSLAGVDDANKQALVEAAEKEIDESVLPAFQALASYFERLEAVATTDDGAWKLPNGEEYYQYLLRHHTTTDMTADQIHELGLQEVARIQAEMQTLFDKLGYPVDAGLPDLFNRVAQKSGFLSGDSIVAGYEAIIKDASQKVRPAFDLLPKADVIVVSDPVGGYYVPPALDGSRPGAFYARATGSQAKFAMPTLAYHEAIPGHHFQLALAQELDLPSMRKGLSFTAYAEGWALYAERLVQEMGFYQEDPYGDLGRLQAELFRAVRLVVDTGIHFKRWTYNEGVAYMLENTGMPQEQVSYEVSRYVAWPGQATAYKSGMLQILKLRQRAQDRLGNKFDLKEFHNVVLGNGSLPLEVLERVVDGYIEEKLEQ